MMLLLHDVAIIAVISIILLAKSNYLVSAFHIQHSLSTSLSTTWKNLLLCRLSSSDFLSAQCNEESFDSIVSSQSNYDHDNYRIFRGKNKWLGGAVDPNDGTIYGIPSNSDEIICLIPPSIAQGNLHESHDNTNDNTGKHQYHIHTIPLPKSVSKGKFKWLRGIICNDCLYGIPAWSNDGVLRLDLKQFWKYYHENKPMKIANNNEVVSKDNYDECDFVSVIPLPDEFHNSKSIDDEKPTRWLWHGAAVNGNKTAIYCIPSNAHHVLKVDLLESKCSLLNIPESETSTPLKQTNKWYGGILGNDDCIYGIPYSASNVLRIDASTDTVSLIGDYGINQYNWHGGVKSDRNGCIYCFPAHHSHVLKIDTNVESSLIGEQRLSLIPINRSPNDLDTVTRYKWLGGSLGADGNVYAMPSDASSILRIDTENNVGTTFGLLSSEKNKWQGGVLLGDIIYAIPSNARHILCIDTRVNNTDNGNITYSLLGYLPSTKDKWQGGFAGNDKSIYCIPENSDKVMKVDPRSTDLDSIITFL